MRRRFTRIPKVQLLTNAGVPAYLIGTYCALSDYAANDTGLCWPRMDTLASTLKIPVRTVQRHLSALRELGLVDFVDRRRTARGRFSSWCYRLVLMASFNKPATTGHSGRPAKTPSNFPRTKREKNPPQTPREKDSSLSGSRRPIKDGYRWLFSP